MCILAYIISVTVLLEEFLVRPVQIFAVVSRLQTEEFFNISNQDLISHNMSSDLSAYQNIEGRFISCMRPPYIQRDESL